MMRRFALLCAFALGAISTALSCRVPNVDHCLHRAADSNAWCAEVDEDRPFCSPCVGENFGCVKSEPTEDECPEYTVPPEETGTDESGTDESGTDESGTDESSTDGTN